MTAAHPPITEADRAFHLRPEDHITREPNVQHFTWHITKGTIAPDGVEKQVFHINNQFPGPILEARSGDIFEIDVFNDSEEGVSLHWHGLYMRGFNHMDGPAGITQCEIPPGGNFTYRIPTDAQAGTFWYHAHSEVQRGDGLYGGLVVYDPPSPDNYSPQYDEELLLLIGDWYHASSAEVLSKFMSQTSLGLEPCPDSILINGLGYFQCSMAVPAAPVNCSEVQRPQFWLNKERRYRLRLVNVGSLTGFHFTIPDSEMAVLSVDGGQPIISNVSNSVGILYPAERVDLLLSWRESERSQDSEIIIQLDNEYFLHPNFALTSTQSFQILSSTHELKIINNLTDVTSFNLQTAKGPVLPEPVKEAEHKLLLYVVVEVLARELNIPKGFINHTTWERQQTPLISQPRDKWDKHQLVPWTGTKPVWVELTINNIDSIGHPFHLHGYDFYVISTYGGNGGWDYYNPFDSSKTPRGGPFNLVDPIRKDTVFVPPYGYAVLRFLADNEGIWALHCHIMWHQASGMSMALQVMGDKHTGLSNSVGGMAAGQFCKVNEMKL
ncbi:iron transport multicopper oxidase fet3 [Mariannaea sp. PMI_226]|nr:iron transport multicopper oxidase fet3 [Mariannaea sp. PMI_226]